MKFRQLALLLMTLSLIALFAACGSNSSPAPAISVTFTAGFLPPSSMNASSSAGIAATVSNDPQNAGVTWSVTCGSAGACGSFDHTATASTIPTTYTAPSAIPSGNTVTVTATSVTDNTKSASAVITIITGGAITVTFNPPARSFINVNATSPYTAVVANDSGNAGVTWSVACGGVNGSVGICGAFSTTSTVSGTPTTYTAPPSIPAGTTVTITATSVTDNTKSASATVTIQQLATSLLDGTYVFQLAGEDINLSNYYVAGAFTVSGGVITGGEQDFVDFINVLSDSFNPATSSISTTGDGNLQVILDTRDPNLGVDGVETLNITPVSSFRALINEFDTFASGTGTLDLQNSAAAPAGGYAFFTTGVDSNDPPQPLVIGGVLNVDGPGSISGNGSVFDINDEGLVAQAQTFAPSTVSPPDGFGRVEINLFPSDVSGVPEITYVGYIVNGNTIRLVESTDNLVGTMGGTALWQGDSTGAFSTANISGTSYVLGAPGEDPNGFLELAGVMTFNSNLSMSGNVTFNDIANQIAANVTAGSYTVDTTGRVTITNLTAGNFGPATIQLYLDGTGNAVGVSMDGFDVTAGQAFQQTAGSSFSGYYTQGASGIAFTSTAADFWSAVGPVFTDGDIVTTGFTDFNLFDSDNDVGVPVPNVALSGVSSGSNNILTGTLTGLDGFSDSVQHNFTYYLIDGTRLFSIETDDTQLGLAYFEALSPCANCAKAKAKTKAKH